MPRRHKIGVKFKYSASRQSVIGRTRIGCKPFQLSKVSKITKLAKSQIRHSANVLSDLPERLSSRLFAGAQLRRLAGGQVLFNAGDAGDGCYRLEQGLLKIAITSPQDEERIVAILGSGAIVGELSMIDGLPRSMSVVAFENCALRFVSRATFEECLQTHSEIGRHLMAILASRLRAADQALAAMSFLTAKGRVARALLDLVDHVGDEDGAGHIIFRQKVSQRDLAAMAGVARENVSRALSEWRQRRLVVRSSSYYRINDLAALEHEIQLDE
jgi:CRP/FNR family transcriptional regulator, cyclic AMP receptor protein